MRADRFISRILEDEALTAGLNDPEARLLIEWLVDRVEGLAAGTDLEAVAWGRFERLCRRARAIRRFVALWCHAQDHGAAAQLAAVERFTWPLPASNQNDPCEVLQPILTWEQDQIHAAGRHVA
jgi:hypothetical protein